MITNATTEAVDNRFWDIDILGSWIEVGMVLIVVLSGIMIAIPTVSGFLKSRKAKKRHLYPCDPQFRRMHSRIHEFLTELRVKTHADRAVVLQFHNGGNFLDGSSIKRFSLTHESCVVGTSESMTSRRDNQASTFVEMLDHLSKNTAVVEATADLPDCHLKRHFESNHTILWAMVPLKDARGVLTSGALLVEWCSWDSADKIKDDVVLREVTDYARYVEGQLIQGGIAHA